MGRADALAAAVEASRRARLLIASADPLGVPHVATADTVRPGGEDHVEITAWFCSTTVNNLEQNPRLSLVVWVAEEGDGYQIVGTVETVDDVAMLDGHTPDLEREAVPQVQRTIGLRVHRVLHFSDAPHRDRPAED